MNCGEQDGGKVQGEIGGNNGGLQLDKGNSRFVVAGVQGNRHVGTIGLEKCDAQKV